MVMASSFVSWLTITLLFFSLLSFTSSPPPPRPEVVTARHGVVAADDSRCSTIGRDVLQKGGHAVDASVAAALCLGVVSPASSGIGGGAFMLVRLANGQAQAFDMRERAPKLASQDMYTGNASLKASGPLSAAVPGELAGLYKVWKTYGKLPWKRLVEPAEKLARTGFNVSQFLYTQMVSKKTGIKADNGLRAIFTSKRGNLLQPGRICRNINLANTLAEISVYGSRAFYNGSIGVNLVRDVRNAGGILKLSDLKKYRVKLREPISAKILGLKILGMPPPSSGGAAMILMLNILAQYGLPSGVSGSLRIHRMIEALKHAFAVRMDLGDPDFIDVKKVISDMLSPKFAAELKKTIHDKKTFDPLHYGGRWNQIHDQGTSHISVVDSERNAVSLTTSINTFFGAQFLSPSTGILLNNQMNDFAIPMNHSHNVPPPAPTNFVRPFKRPLSSMAPTIVLKGKRLKAVLGASGGVTIIAGITEVFLNHFVKKMDPLSSIMAPRYYHQLIPNVLYYENWTTATGYHFEVPRKTRAALQKKGHVLHKVAGRAVCQFVVQELEASRSGNLVGVSDPRKGGFPAGF